MTVVKFPEGTDASAAAAYSTVVSPFPLVPIMGPVLSVASVTAVV
jgi:hypothetical protein